MELPDEVQAIVDRVMAKARERPGPPDDATMAAVTGDLVAFIRSRVRSVLGPDAD